MWGHQGLNTQRVLSEHSGSSPAGTRPALKCPPGRGHPGWAGAAPRQAWNTEE